MKKTIEGSNLWGEKRKYTFNLLDAETGLHIFYELGPGIFERIEGLEEISIKKAIPIVFEFLHEEKVKELAGKLLKDATIEINGKFFEAGETGISSYCEWDPSEIHAAIFHSLRANFPKYIETNIRSSS